MHHMQVLGRMLDPGEKGKKKKQPSKRIVKYFLKYQVNFYRFSRALCQIRTIYICFFADVSVWKLNLSCYLGSQLVQTLISVLRSAIFEFLSLTTEYLLLSWKEKNSVLFPSKAFFTVTLLVTKSFFDIIINY